MKNPGWLSLVVLLACNGGEEGTATEPLEDLATEPCNGVDDDGDGLFDEGNDQDGDGIPDCFDVEECDGIDNDGDGEIDEDTDVDGDGLGDCFDVEECDGIDNDGDGGLDEDFPEGCDPCNGVDDDGDGEIDEDGVDTDEDGVPDCQDVEECDGWDNDGDGLIDEDLDADFDGVCDGEDPEVCDGWDNDGDGLVDEGWDADGDGAPDCWIAELCDGIDNDGDGEVDEGFGDGDGDGVSDCAATCPAATDFTICEWVGSDFNCSYGDPITVSSTTNGIAVTVDMSNWRTLQIHTRLADWTGIVLNVCDSSTCNGYGGDAGTSVHDAEGQLDGGGWHVYGPDGGPLDLLNDPDAADPLEEDVVVQVCDGWVGFWSRNAGARTEVSGASVYQFDGNEPDPERPSGINDRLLHLGVGRTYGDPGRNGTGAEGVVLVLGR